MFYKIGTINIMIYFISNMIYYLNKVINCYQCYIINLNIMCIMLQKESEKTQDFINKKFNIINVIQ